MKRGPKYGSVSQNIREYTDICNSVACAASLVSLNPILQRTRAYPCVCSAVLNVGWLLWYILIIYQKRQRPWLLRTCSATAYKATSRSNLVYCAVYKVWKCDMPLLCNFIRIFVTSRAPSNVKIVDIPNFYYRYQVAALLSFIVILHESSQWNIDADTFNSVQMMKYEQVAALQC